MAEEIEVMAPFRGSTARQRPNNSSKPAAATKQHILSRLHEIEGMNESERNAWIQSIENLTWKQTMEFTKQFDKQRRKNRPVQQPLIGMENESHSCPERLPEARDGPGVEPDSNIYRMLAKPRTACGVERPEHWAIADPPNFIPDDGYEDETDRKIKWSKIKIDNVEFRAQWDVQNESQAKEYRESPYIFPVVQNGSLGFTLENDEAMYEPVKSFIGDWLSDDEDEHELWSEHEHKISSFDIPNQNARKQFRSWWDQLPTAYPPVNIYRAAFFDGTAMPDGQCSMILPNIKHIPTPRDMKDELTRSHWHETSAGYVYNMGPVNQKRRKKQQEREEYLRRTAPYRAWLNLPPESKIVPPDIYLRPAEMYDASYIIEIMNWYAKNSALSGDIESVDLSDFEKLLRYCRNLKLPFVVAARRPQERWCRNQIDPAIGYAYVDFHRNGTGADAHMGELQVVIQEDSKKKHVGRALVDMVLSCFNVTSKTGTDYQFDQTGTVQYGPGYGRPLNTMVCAIAASKAGGENNWVKRWLEKDFGFNEKGVFEGARVKNGQEYVFVFVDFAFGCKYSRTFHRFDLCYMARRIGAPNATEDAVSLPPSRIVHASSNLLAYL